MLLTTSHVANAKPYIKYRTAIGCLPLQTGRRLCSARLFHGGYRPNRQQSCFIPIGVPRYGERNAEFRGFLCLLILVAFGIDRLRQPDLPRLGPRDRVRDFAACTCDATPVGSVKSPKRRAADNYRQPSKPDGGAHADQGNRDEIG